MHLYYLEDYTEASPSEFLKDFIIAFKYGALFQGHLTVFEWSFESGFVHRLGCVAALLKRRVCFILIDLLFAVSVLFARGAAKRHRFRNSAIGI